ncbi:MAG: RING finger protein [bacterium]
MAEERIVFRCPCGQAIAAPRQAIGKQARCPKCGRVAPVPAQTETQGPARKGPQAVEPDALVGRVCSICQNAIRPGETACLCSACRSPYHRECWDEVGGCATYGCQLMPQAAKPAEPDQRTEGWGDEKHCPRCGRTIRSAAVKCRYCKARFPSAVPMTRGEYREWRDQEAQLQPTRVMAIVVFVASLFGCLGPLVLLGGGLWLWGAHDALKRVGGVPQVLAYFGLGLSAIYSILMLVVFVF